MRRAGLVLCCVLSSASLATPAALATPVRQDPAEFEHGSFVEIETLTPAQVESLVTLGKVWGFVKYHHPRVAAGELDFDAELLRVLPAVLDAPERAACAQALVAWLDELGAPAPCAPCAEAPIDPHLAPELDWLADEARLGAELAARLARIHRDRFAGTAQHYVAFVPQIGNPDFAREKAYAQFAEPDAGYRLLALFRFWNVIAWWFPYRDVIGADWDAVLAEFVPRFATARGAEAYQRELLALIARAHDTHANLWSSLEARPPTGAALLPVLVRFIEGRALVTGTTDPARPPAALRVGDVLLALDGEPVERLVERWAPYYAASNEPTRRRDLARELTRGAPGPVALRVERDGAELELTEERRPVAELGPERGATHDLAGPTFRLLAPEVGYLKLSTIQREDIAAHLAAAAGTRGLVLDLRNYPSAFVVFALGQHLVREPTPFVRFTQGTAANPGAFLWGVTLSVTPHAPHYDGRVVILVDEVTQSQAEYTAMAFRVAPGALVVGSTTAGADGNVSSLVLPGGLGTMISGIGIFYPDGRPTQRVGIVPDIEVLPTVAGLRAGRDEVLEAGLRAILGPGSEAEAERIARAALASAR